MNPATKFHLVTQIVMTEYQEQRDDPPGRAPYKEVKTVLAQDAKEIRPHEVKDAVRKLLVGS